MNDTRQAQWETLQAVRAAISEIAQENPGISAASFEDKLSAALWQMERPILGAMADAYAELMQRTAQ